MVKKIIQPIVNIWVTDALVVVKDEVEWVWATV